MNTPNIVVLTEVGGLPLGPGHDHAVYINPAHIVEWTSAKAPKGATSIKLVGIEYELFVRESPREVFHLVTGDELPELEAEPNGHIRAL